MLMATVVAMALIWGGCSGFADEVRSGQGAAAQPEETMETAVGLYESMVAVFEEDTAGVDRAVEETLTVISRYEAVDGERRRRFIGRVVPLRGGIGVRITAEYQVVDESVDGGWDDEPREVVEAEAEPVELALARSVERRFHGGAGRR